MAKEYSSAKEIIEAWFATKGDLEKRRELYEGLKEFRKIANEEDLELLAEYGIGEMLHMIFN